MKRAVAVHQHAPHCAQALNVRREKTLSESSGLSSVESNSRASALGDRSVRSVESSETEELRCEQGQR